MKYDKIKESLIYKYERDKINEQLKLCREGFEKEYENMDICSKNNEYSVKCYEYFNDENKFVIIMELCDKNLSQLLTERISNDNKRFNIEEILKIMNQLNKTFKIMKKNNIIHRDLKLENILIKYKDKEHKEYIMKITDYGSSKRLNSLSKLCYTKNVGTVEYMAPEILNGKDYDYKCDLWSIV